MADPIDLPDARDGLTRRERVVLWQLAELEKERPGRNVATAELYGRVLEHVDLSVARGSCSDDATRYSRRLCGHGRWIEWHRDRSPRADLDSDEARAHGRACLHVTGGNPRDLIEDVRKLGVVLEVRRQVQARWPIADVQVFRELSMRSNETLANARHGDRDESLSRPEELHRHRLWSSITSWTTEASDSSVWSNTRWRAGGISWRTIGGRPDNRGASCGPGRGTMKIGRRARETNR